MSDFSEDIDRVIEESRKSGIDKIYMPNIDSHSIKDLLALNEKYPNHCIPMIGLHPCYVKEDFKNELLQIELWLKKREFCAIGEVGIDLYWDRTHINQQISVFKTQIAWAKELDLPLIIHCRDSLDLTIEIVEELQDGKLKGIFHCFTGNLEQAHKIIGLKFLLGIGGVVTFKNGGLDKVIPDLDLKNIVLETDSPYLAPTPYRGKRNTPSYLPYIANRIAELKSCEVESVAFQTTNNAEDLF